MLFNLLIVQKNIETRNLPCSRSGKKQAAQHANSRGLAGAIRAQEAEDFAFMHRKIEILHGLEVPYALATVLGLDCKFRHW